MRDSAIILDTGFQRFENYTFHPVDSTRQAISTDEPITMSDLDENLAPVPAEDVDPRALDTSPTAEEFFILSRLDGSMTIDQVCKTSGLGKSKTLACIANLRSYGLIRLPGDSTSSNNAAPPPPSENKKNTSPSGVGRESSASTDKKEKSKSKEPKLTQDDLGELLRSRFPLPFSDFDFDEELLAQQVEIDDDFKREILFIYEQIDSIGYYELLGLDRDAKRRQLRRAYFPLSKRYHPDRFYRKILGDYEPMLKKIFQRVTTAYQTLSDRNKREEYDASLRRGRSSHATPIRASTPASRRSEPQAVIQGDRKRKMAHKVLVQRGDKAMKADRVAAALREYRKALTLHRDLELALRVARKLLQRDGFLNDAVSFARTAHNIDSNSQEALELLGRIFEKKGDEDDALYHYEMALELADDDSELKKIIARLKH